MLFSISTATTSSWISEIFSSTLSDKFDIFSAYFEFKFETTWTLFFFNFYRLQQQFNHWLK